MGSGFFSQDNPPPLEQGEAAPGPGNVVVQEPTGVDGATASFFGRGASPALQAFEEDAAAKAAEAAASAAAAANSAQAASASAGEALNVANALDDDVAAAQAAAAASQNSATASQGSATAASTSAGQAATSATQAANSATNALSSANAANTSATNSASSATNAASSASAAASSATSASGSATTATTKASEASASASQAASSATNAANSASAAGTSATNAATSATNASNSASAAGTSATNAAASATTATTKASEASTSATNAAASATSASGSASTATTKASEAAASATSAAGSASTATTKASEASTSATNAANSASAASTSATAAGTSATNAANSATAAAGSATAAGTSATNAANSASAAATSATNAANSASAAGTSATNAATSATSASTAQAAAESARDATLAAFDSFDDRYLGTKTSNPTVDNDGNALVAGALYFNSTAGEMRVYTGSSWTAAYVSGAGVLLIANNLSDVANAATARTNLGLGNVENKSSATVRSEITSGNVTTALGFTPANKAGDTFTGAVTFSGGVNANFAIKAEGGTEGGQFLLEKAPSGSTFSGNHIVIDTVGDVLRLFDGGGSNPGAYINLKSQANGAGSRILTETTLTSGNVTTALGFTPYNASNPSGYISGITSGMVTTALGYTPYNASNPNGYISGITSGNVTTALGYTPANRAGDTFTNNIAVQVGSNQVVIGGSDGSIEITRSGGSAYIDFKDSTGEDFDARIQQAGSGFSLTGLLTVTGGGLNAAVKLGNLNGNRDWRVMQKDGGYFAITDETAGAERVTIGSNGLIGLNADVLVSSGLFVGGGNNSSTIYMSDVDEGQRLIHCNSNRIGFLTQAGGWGSWCDDDGSWRNDTYVQTPILYDINNTAYYVDPNGATSLRTYGDWRADNSPWTGEFAGKIQYHGNNWYLQAAGNWEFRRADAATAFYVNQTGTAWASSDMRAPIFYDTNDTSFYVNPNGETQLNTLKVRGETQFPGSMNGDWDGGYYHFGPENNTPGGSWGHAEIIRLDSNWNVQTFWPTANSNEIWTRRRLNGTYSAWRRMLQEDEWIGSKYFGSDGAIYGTIFMDANDGSYYCNPNGTSVFNGLNLNGVLSVPQNNNSTGGGINFNGAGNAFIRGRNQDGASATLANLQLQSWYGIGFGPSISGMTVPVGENAVWIDTRLGDLYARRLLIAQQDVRAPLFYDSDNTGYYFDGNNTTRVNAINADSVYSFGNVSAEGDFVVGAGKNFSNIYMQDGDEGQRQIHCNSNAIGFLTQAGAWGAYCHDDGYWQSNHSMRSPIFYDSQDTSCYLDPGSTSRLNNIEAVGLVIGRSSASTDVNAANDTGSFSVRGSSTTVAAMTFHRTGAFAINMGVGTDNVFRIGGWSASSNCLQLDSTGNLTALGNVTAYSDARIKKDVETISGALDMISAMRGVRYTRIDNDQPGIGVIAQEVLEVVPEVVQQGVGDDDTLSVAYGNLVGVLIEAIKELKSEVDNLKATVH